MNLKSFYNSSKLLTGIFILSLLVLVFIANISYNQILSVSKSENLVLHSYRVHIELEQLHSYLKDAETGQRGYIATHDSLYLEPYLGARQNVNKSFIKLRSFTSDNRLQQQNLDTLFNLINKGFAWMVSSIRLSKTESQMTELLKTHLFEEKKAMDTIRNHINKMIDVESGLLQKREKLHQDNVAFTPFVSLMVVMFSLLIFVFSFYKINKDRIALKNLNQQLLIRNKELELQIMDEFSSGFAGYKTGDELINSLTQDLALKTKLDYVMVGELLNDGINESAIKTLSFYDNGKQEDNIQFNLANGPWAKLEIGKLISFPKDCKLNYTAHPIIQVYNIEGFIGCPLFSAEAKPIGLIAVMHHKEIKELSYTKSLLKIAARRMELELEKINYQKTLETKNYELERHNAELASFNYVASHDLQEPLRKIITFSNRLFQKYEPSLPEGSKEYLNRIMFSAKRMSALIEDLLNFSWISNTKDIFKETDLNEIVKEVLVDLDEVIDEKNASINVGPLPVIIANPLQMTQLFLNLLGNALKFTKEGVTPEISISAKTMSSSELNSFENLQKNLSYTKISIKDNGIGFDQKYSDKIFTIFQRLHGKNEYSGTGIGLALSRKIAENHNGEITAQSETNKGAIFSIILPKAERR